MASGPAAANTAAHDRASVGQISRSGGARLIQRARRILEPEREAGARASAAAHTPDRGLTAALVRLARALPRLPRAQRRVARGLLARPTDSPDPDDEAYSSAEMAHLASDCTAHFCVHWIDDAGFANAPDLTDLAPANGLPDYVDAVEAAAEQVYTVENGTLGWQAPKPDGALGGGPETDIYLADIGDSGLFGYASPDPGQVSRRRFAYLVIDDDYAPLQYPGTTPLTDAEVTLAHEYNHVLQFSLNTYQDIWFMESTATWMEDQVYGSVNDYLRYLDRWNDRVQIPITHSNVKAYGSAVWNHWLAHRYGPSIVRSAWQVSDSNFAVYSYDTAIRAAGPSDFTLDFARFARDLGEWRTATAFPEGGLYPDVERQGSLPTSGARRNRVLDHTTYRLLRVHPAAARSLRVKATGKHGVATALAVVGRIGAQTAGTVVSDLALKRNRGTMKVRLARPGRFDRITVVVINADARVSGPGLLDWRYTGNGARVAVRASLIR
ncbi:MAG: MXAN_6640 family putative metalloprotease [Solirubrobacterales bacterium]